MKDPKTLSVNEKKEVVTRKVLQSTKEIFQLDLGSEMYRASIDM